VNKNDCGAWPNILEKQLAERGMHNEAHVKLAVWGIDL